jgi:hypothetical protein
MMSEVFHKFHAFVERRRNNYPFAVVFFSSFKKYQLITGCRDILFLYYNHAGLNFTKEEKIVKWFRIKLITETDY